MALLFSVNFKFRPLNSTISPRAENSAPQSEYFRPDYAIYHLIFQGEHQIMNLSDQIFALNISRGNIRPSIIAQNDSRGDLPRQIFAQNE